MADGMGVVVTTTQMYQLLQTIDHKLTTLTIEVAGGASTIRDHEARLREIEAREDHSRRLAEIEARQHELSENIDNIKRLTYAIPSMAVLASVVAIILAISDKL